jgi:redox-sensitive bicupin YhaK (pirin superfamily)
MNTIRRANERGHADLGWLNSYHSFSFAEYYDPRHMGFGQLRVINDDVIAAGRGFGTHPHRDMEIITYVLDGELEHKDSMGNGSVMRHGDVQRMSAGTGVAHSEYNHSTQRPVHLLQIWILPDAQGHQPGYEQKFFGDHEKRGRLRLVASGSGREGSVAMNQDADILAGLFHGAEQAEYTVREGRDVWLQVARGALTVNGEPLSAGDGLATRQPGSWKLAAGDDAEILIFDMARAA